MRLKFAEEEMNFLGIRKCKGVNWILEVISGKKELNKLTPKQHQEIVEAWESKEPMPASAYRRYVPKLKGENYSDDAEKIIKFFA